MDNTAVHYASNAHNKKCPHARIYSLYLLVFFNEACFIIILLFKYPPFLAYISNRQAGTYITVYHSWPGAYQDKLVLIIRAAGHVVA